MPKKPVEGDTVRVSDREPVTADTRSGLFYPHYRGLTGTLAKVYGDGTASVTVDLESLPEDARARHEAGVQKTRQKWLDGLSDEARNRLSAAEKKFQLRYTILVSTDDLTRFDAPRTEETAPRAKASAAEEQPALDLSTSTAPARKSLEDLEAEETRHLEEVARKKAR